jgi:uncharacterized membrane protein
VDWTRDRLGYVVLGVGVGALADGFVLHQLLQWHHLLSSRRSTSTVDGLEENTLADGIFHVTFLAVVLVGIAMLRGRRVETRPLIGLGLVGWGAFNVVDQIVFHLALDAHHIRMVENYQFYDWSFFALGVALIAAGFAVARPTARR